MKMIRFTSYNCNSIRNNSELVKDILKLSDIVFLQEIMLSKSDLPLLYNYDNDFDHVAFVNDRESEGICEGRPSSGVAIFWRKFLSTFITPILVNDSLIGLILGQGNLKVLLLNIYMPCDLQTFEALDKYRNMMATIGAVINEQNIHNIILAGDFNADPSKGRFWKELNVFIKDFSLLVVDDQLPIDTFTYLCPARSITSWLDHILCSQGISKSISNVFVKYNVALFDHFPICFTLNLSFDFDNSAPTNSLKEKMVNWSLITDRNKVKIASAIDESVINNGYLLNEVFLCNVINCDNENHLQCIDECFANIKNTLLMSTKEYLFDKSRAIKVIPGWNSHVKELYKEARKQFLLWKQNGRPLNGEYLEKMKFSRSQFKTALRECRKNEDQLRKEKLLSNLSTKNYKAFWKEVNNIRKNKDVPCNVIDGVKDPEMISKKFSDKYRLLFDRYKSKYKLEQTYVTDAELSGHSANNTFSKRDVYDVINLLRPGIGFDGLHSNHLIMSSDLMKEFIAMFFSSLLIHGYFPKDMLKGTITPIIKDKFGDHSSLDNYRPVMSSSVILKAFEYCLSKKITPYIHLNDRQHGYRKNYSTTTACFTLKETVLNYVKSKSDVYCCFLDISKAFDNVDHDILLNKLHDQGIPKIYINAIKYWYAHQIVNVKYLNSISESWSITNGVRQGGVLSGLFFCIYIDSLINSTTDLKLGCKLGIMNANIIVYADDIVLLAPSASSLQTMINHVNIEVNKLNLQFNVVKSKCMLFSSKEVSIVRPFLIDGVALETVKCFKYLGMNITDDLSNSNDVYRVKCKFYSDFNCLLRKFSFADTKTKVFLFKQFCLQLYGCELWFNCKKSLKELKEFAVGYHKAIKKILGLSYHESNHFACQEAQLLTFENLLNKIKIMAAFRMLSLPCNFVSKTKSFLQISSCFLKETCDILADKYEIDSLLDNDRDAIFSRIIYVQCREKPLRLTWE